MNTEALVNRSDPTAQCMPRKLNLGCGYDVRKGYLNVDFQDFHKPDMVGDVRDLPTLPSGYFEEVVAQDVLEHLPRLDTPVALAEWNRLLSVGGLLHLRAPNVIGLAELCLAPERQSIDDQKMLIQCLFGTQAYNGDWHLTGFTEKLLRYYLEEAGFAVVRIDCKDHWLFEATARKIKDLVFVSAEVQAIAGEGFYGWEGDWRQGAHSWSAGNATLILQNSDKRAVDAEFTFVLGSLAKRRVTIITPSDEKAVELQPGKGERVGPFVLRLEPGETRILFNTGDPAAMPAGGGDSRQLAFSVSIELNAGRAIAGGKARTVQFEAASPLHGK